jgi:para-aminobenzoate synthetase component 1
VLLHSGADHDGCGRWSFVACEPELVILCRGGRTELHDRTGGSGATGGDDPLPLLERLVAERAAASPGPGPVPCAIGYLGYDLARRWFGLPPRRNGVLPEMCFGLYGAVLRFDHREGRVDIVGHDPAARRRLARALETGEETPAAPPRFAALERAAGAGDDWYRAAFARVLAYIAAGDVYQINLARPLCAPLLSTGDPLGLYAALDAIAPASHGALLELGDAALVSLSPERFLWRPPGSQYLETRPIKGTRRRSGDAATDRARAADLAADPKERAEHVMIVDLERNDLGMVAQTGTVRVDSLARIVELPTLHHMISTVSCRLRPEVGSAALLRAVFPGGSITGAPKRRAMEIIDELELVARGPYTGAIGYLGGRGELELSIAIRTAVLAGGQLSLHVGGGVVADSTAGRELEETEEKAAAWRRCLAQLAGPAGAAPGARPGEAP